MKTERQGRTSKRSTDHTGGRQAEGAGRELTGCATLPGFTIRNRYKLGRAETTAKWRLEKSARAGSAVRVRAGSFPGSVFAIKRKGRRGRDMELGQRGSLFVPEGHGMGFVVEGLQREGAGLHAIDALFLKPGDEFLQLKGKLLEPQDQFFGCALSRDAIRRGMKSLGEGAEKGPRRLERRRFRHATLPEFNRDPGIETLGIVAHGHDEGEQLLLGFIGSGKAVQHDAAGRKMHAGRQSLEFLVHDGGRGFDENAWVLLSFAVQLVENRVEAVPALNFEAHGLTRCQAAEMPDDLLPVGQPIFADRLADQRLQDLLGAPAADAEYKFERGAIHPRGGKSFELFDGNFEPGMPGRFVRHARCSMQLY